jgi:DNA-directed RNA polymerase specialized sigma24 family protein
MSDLDLHLAAIAAGDADAFALWLAGAERIIRGTLRPFARAVDTEAVLQETLLRVWQVAPRFVSDGKPNGLLRLGVRIGRNLAVSESRKMRASPVEAEQLERAIEALASTEVSAPDPLLRDLIHECREKLPDKPKKALAERIDNGGAEHDSALAERLHMRLNTFLQNITRARKLLAQCLEAHGVDLKTEQT